MVDGAFYCMKKCETDGIDVTNSITDVELPYFFSEKYMQYDGKNVLHSSAWWYDDDGTKHPAFCVDPKLAGPGEIAAGKYDVNGTVN